MTTDERNVQRQRVRDYLSRYKIIKRRIAQLTKRLTELQEDENEPINGIRYSVMPKGSKVSDGAAAYLYRKEDVIEQINTEIQNKYKALSDALIVLKAIPLDSIERNVIESKYIDNLSNDDICQEMYWSYVSTVTYHTLKAIDMIIDNEISMAIINEYYEVNYENKTD